MWMAAQFTNGLGAASETRATLATIPGGGGADETGRAAETGTEKREDSCYRRE